MGIIRIGTRKSPLALWQANKVAEELKLLHINSEIITITSEGDMNLVQPIYEIGISGVFTRSLDIALLSGKIDIAVHSLKDVPTLLPNQIELKGCLKRGNPYDILVYKSDDIYQKKKRIIATGSLRRKAFWLNKYPEDQIENLRGNVQLRIQKVIDANWDGGIFAYAGLERSGILDKLDSLGLKYEVLNWMIPAPSQGIIGITALNDFQFPSIVNHEEAEICAKIEREFLNTMEGGCTAPIGAQAEILGDLIKFSGALLSLNGKEILGISEEFSRIDYIGKGNELAKKLLYQGADKMMEAIRIELEK